MVDGALFCHRCGRPTRPLTAAEAQEEPVVTPDPAPFMVEQQPERLRAAASHLPPEIGFHNPAAVRVAVMLAALGTLLGLLPVPAVLNIFWKLVTLIAAGFIAVYVYHRRTGDLPSVRGGVRIGWMTGMFSFVLALILSVAGVLAMSSQGGFTTVLRKQLSAARSPGELDEIMRVLESPSGLVTLVTMLVMVLFIIFTALPMIGGALGAKVLEKE